MLCMALKDRLPFVEWNGNDITQDNYARIAVSVRGKFYCIEPAWCFILRHNSMLSFASHCRTALKKATFLGSRENVPINDKQRPNLFDTSLDS